MKRDSFFETLQTLLDIPPDNILSATRIFSEHEEFGDCYSCLLIMTIPKYLDGEERGLKRDEFFTTIKKMWYLKPEDNVKLTRIVIEAHDKKYDKCEISVIVQKEDKQ